MVQSKAALFSVLDPNKTFSLPTRQLANGVVDAFVHVMEQYLTYPVNAQVQDRFAECLLQTLIEIGPKILEDSADYDTRANLMWAASIARVWQIVEGDEEQRIDTAIARTRAFFEQLGLPTRLSDYELGETDIEIIITQLKSHNLTQLGEHKNVSLEISRQILATSI